LRVLKLKINCRSVIGRPSVHMIDHALTIVDKGRQLPPFGKDPCFCTELELGFSGL